MHLHLLQQRQVAMTMFEETIPSTENDQGNEKILQSGLMPLSHLLTLRSGNRN